MAWWNRNKKVVEERDALSDILGANVDASVVTKEQAMNVPSVAACVNLITDTVASLPIRLYKVDESGDSSEVKNDARIALLNTDTGDTLNPYQMKKQMIEDMLMDGAAYTYINKQRNSVKSLNYVGNRQVGVSQLDPNPIFKKYEFNVNGQVFQEYEFIKLTRKTTDGVSGTGIVRENNKVISVAYQQLCFEDMMYRLGGQKKGFLKSANKLSTDAMNALKTAFSNLYKNSDTNIVVLNNGMEFQEANNSSVEMQVNQNKISNDEAIFKIFGVPVELLNGKATGGNELLFESFVKMAILPILKAYETSLNRDLLLVKEKGQFEFKFDTNELHRGDILKRFQAYEYAVKNGILQIDEIRQKEGYKSLELDFIKLGLQDVLYFANKKEIYTPNTNRLAKLGDAPEGGDGTGTQPEPSVNPDKEVNVNEDESGNQGK